MTLVCVGVCVKHLWTCPSLWDHTWPLCDTLPRSRLQRIDSSPLTLRFGLSGSVYFYCCSLLVGLVFPTFLSVWNKTGSETREEKWASEVCWEEGRGDGCKTGCETEEEREPRRSQSRETGSSTSKLNLPSQQGLARRYLTYYFTLAYLKS